MLQSLFVPLFNRNKIIIAFFITLAVFTVGLIAKQQTLTQRQELIHERGSLVMPFDLDKTTHVFANTDSGSFMQVKTKDPNDTEQIALIRSHLKKEAENFSSADFSDPKSLHGEDMPGLDVLSSSEGAFNVEYQELADGAQLTFNTTDPEITYALHMWFMAQMADHGPDAVSM